MTFWHALQVALAGAVLVDVVLSARRLLFLAACDTAALLETIDAARRAGQHDLALTIAHDCEPAWAAIAAAALLDSAAGPARARRELEERLGKQENAALNELTILRSLGRMASPLAFLAIVIELAHAFGGNHGLLALQRGLVESLAIGHALLSFAIGLGTTLVALTASTQLRAALRQRRAEAQRALAFLAANVDSASM